MELVIFFFFIFQLQPKKLKDIIYIYIGKNVRRVCVEPLTINLCTDFKLIWTERAIPVPAWPQLTMLNINTLTIERSRVTWDPLPFIIKQLSCLLGNVRSVPLSYGLVSCEWLRDSRSPHNRGGQLEVLAEAGFVLSARPSGKRAGFQGWWWGEEKCFPFCSAASWFVLRHLWKDLHFLPEANRTFLTSHLLPQAFTRASGEIFFHPWWRWNAFAHHL